MSIIAKSEGTIKRELTPEGNHIARCVQMIHIGTSEHDYGKGGVKRQDKVRLVWELPEEKYTYTKDDVEHEVCFMIGKEYTLSMHEKASLRKDLQSWRGKAFSEDEAKEFDVTKLLGVACMLNVIHVTKGDSTYANIGSISTMPKSVKAPAQVGESIEFNFTDKFHVLVDLPEWLQDKIKESDEYAEALEDGDAGVEVPVENLEAGEDEDGDLPF